MSDLLQCEVFLRGVLAFADETTSDEMWQQCQRHEWADFLWDAQAPTEKGPGAIVPGVRRLPVKRIEDLY